MFLKMLKTLKSLLSKRDKRILFILLIMSIVVSFIETFSISAIMIFISTATNFDIVLNNQYTHFFYNMLGCSSPAQFVIIFGFFLTFFYLLRATIHILHLYSISRFSYNRYHHFSNLLFQRFLQFPYRAFVDTNPTTIGHAIFSYTGILTQMIFSLLSFIAEMFTVLCIYGMLFYVNWKMTLVLSFLLSIKSCIIIKIFSRTIGRSGKKTQKFNMEASQVFHEAYGNFKLIKLGMHEQSTMIRFSEKTYGSARTQMGYAVVHNLPRFILETIGFLILISIIVYVIYCYNNASFVLPVVSLYALAFYRLFPSLNKILTSINQVIFAQTALFGIVDFLQSKPEYVGNDALSFEKNIKIKNLTFCYTDNKPIFHTISLTINKGERIAFVGKSGSGKSTLVDVLMGLYEPSHGTILVDDIILEKKHNHAWRKLIGYIPQSVYLFDGTVADNVVFGRPYDEEALISVLKRAHIYDFLLTEQGLETKVGEAGIKLSGGQKQRIAIARALYTNPQILILDEATSALDHITESSIMDAMYQTTQGVTLIIIAHRLSTIAQCDTIYKLSDGTISRVTFQSIANNAEN